MVIFNYSNAKESLPPSQPVVVNVNSVWREMLFVFQLWRQKAVWEPRLRRLVFVQLDPSLVVQL
jgi:hypothetical protein